MRRKSLKIWPESVEVPQADTIAKRRLQLERHCGVRVADAGLAGQLLHRQNVAVVTESLAAVELVRRSNSKERETLRLRHVRDENHVANVNRICPRREHSAVVPRLFLGFAELPMARH